jgi:glycosyltransferase involved in cell wall biosynthesis
MQPEHSITVVAATHNRADRLARMLDALAAQTVGTDRFDVIVVDDASSDETPRVLAERAATGPLRLSTFRQERGAGPAAARNRGWRAAGGDLIAFTDDDCEPVPEWLEQLVASANGGSTIVQGRTLPNPAETQHLGVFARTIEIRELSPHYPTCNILYPKTVLDALDGFDEAYGAPAGEDTDLGCRAEAAGIKTEFAPDALVYHAVHQRGALDSLRDAHRATDCVKAYRDHPGLRAHLANGVFFHPSHPLLAQAVLAAALTPKTRYAALFALPYAAHLVRRCQYAKSPVYHAPFVAARDCVEVVATLRGALRHRVAVL